MARKKSGRIVELSDGRIGFFYIQDVKSPITGKMPIYVYQKIKKEDLFNPKSDLSALNLPIDKILVDTNSIKIIGCID